MRVSRGDDHDVRELIRRGASSWSGPSPRAGQSRWAVAAARRRHRGRAVGLAVAVAGATMVVLGTSLLVTGAVAPGSPAGSITRVMSGALAPAPETAQPAAPSVAPLPTSPLPATPGGAAAPVPQPSARRASPSPARWGEREDDRRPSPSPSQSASPSPSHRPDD